MKKFIYSLSILFSLLFQPVSAQFAAIDWETFMKAQDYTSTTMDNWQSGLFTGNGLMGTMLFKSGNTIRMDVGRTDIFDHQPGSVAVMDRAFFKARLRIGYFQLNPAGTIQSIDGRIDIWNAESRCKITTNKGIINLTVFTASDTNVIFAEAETTGEESAFTWSWTPFASITTRTSSKPATYSGNPAHVLSKTGNIDICNQVMKAGGGYTTAWKEETDNGKRNLFVTVQYSQTDNNLTKTQAVDQLNAVASAQIATIKDTHRNWWHSYLPQSYLSIPDAKLLKFYWMQQYKLGSATREGKPAIDLQGPWTNVETPWPLYWFNLNIQLTYSPVFTANRLELFKPVIKMLTDNEQALINNVPAAYRHNSAALGRVGPPDMDSPVFTVKGNTVGSPAQNYEAANLTWLMLYYWQQYRYSMDASLLDKFYPLLKRSINYYINLLGKNEKGQWEIDAVTHSPEYASGRNTNYDLSALRWGLKTLLRVNKEQNYQDTQETQWQDILDNLIPYPENEDGYMVHESKALDGSHRHYSHLMMIYPYYDVNWTQLKNRSLIQRSKDHWQSMTGALQGYSFSGNAAMCAMMGQGAEARDALNRLLNNYVKPNSMYLESGPVIETPLAAASSLQDMMIQSWSPFIQVFPAIPADWKNVRFDNFRTEGAFLVSAERIEGVNTRVKVKSLAGGDLMIEPNLGENFDFESTVAGLTIKKVAPGCYSCYMPANAEITLTAK